MVYEFQLIIHLWHWFILNLFEFNIFLLMITGIIITLLPIDRDNYNYEKYKRL